MSYTFEQLSTRQELLSEAYINSPKDFNWVKGELERIAAKLPKSKKETYYKMNSKEYSDLNKSQDIYYWEPSWNNNIDD